MNFRTEMEELVFRYLKEAHPQKYVALTLAEVRESPYYKIVWAWWRALAHYKMKNYYFSLEEVPELPFGAYIHVVFDREVVEYRKGDCGWVRGQSMSYEGCMNIYEDSR